MGAVLVVCGVGVLVIQFVARFPALTCARRDNAACCERWRLTRGFLPLLGLVVGVRLAARSSATHGFRVVTTEGARRLAVENHSPTIPDVALIDQNGTRFSLDAYRGRVLLVDFIYTDCPTICGVLGSNLAEVMDLLSRDGGVLQHVSLLSISFDPARDGPRELSACGARFGATAPHWRVAVPATAEGLRALLKTFGEVIIPDQFGGFTFTRNDSVYLVDRQGRLVRILDPDAPATLLAEAARSGS
jgi:protein SCO1